MNIQLAENKHSNLISKLHYQYIKGFLSSLGTSFLKLMYQSMINSKYTFCIVAEEDGKVIGFVSGAISVEKFYKEFLMKNLFKASIILLPKVLNPSIVRNIFETLLYPTKKEQNLPDAELLSIAVDKSYQGKGISQRLFKILVEKFKRRGINQFKAIVGSNLKAACKFYEKMNGILHSEIEIHKGVKSRIYVWNI